MICKSTAHPTALHVGETTRVSNSRATFTPQHELNPSRPIFVPKHNQEEINHTNGASNILPSEKQIVCEDGTSKGISGRTRLFYMHCLTIKAIVLWQFFDHFKENGFQNEYILSTGTGTYTTAGRQVTGYIVSRDTRWNNIIQPTTGA